MVASVETRSGRVLLPDEEARIRNRFNDLLASTPPGTPLLLPHVAQVAGRRVGSFYESVRVAMVTEEILREKGIADRLSDVNRQVGIPPEIVLEIALAVREPRKPKPKEREEINGQKTHEAGVVLAPSAVLWEKHPSIDDFRANAEVIFEADDDQTGEIRWRLDAFRAKHPEEKTFNIIKTVAEILGCSGQTVRNRLGAIAVSGEHLSGGRTRKGSWEKVERIVISIGLPDPRRTKIGKEEVRIKALEGRLIMVETTRERKPPKAIIGLTIVKHSTTDGVQSKPEHELGPLTLDEPEILHLARALRAFYIAYQLNDSLHTNGISISREQFQSIWANIISNRINEILNLRQVHAGLVGKLLNVVGNYDLLIAQNPTKIHMLFDFFKGFRGDRDKTRLENTLNIIFGVVGLSISR